MKQCSIKVLSVAAANLLGILTIFFSVFVSVFDILLVGFSLATGLLEGTFCQKFQENIFHYWRSGGNLLKI